eukprot:2977054-Pleurochrysis_carterae.AAC.1
MEFALATKEWGRAMNAPGSPDRRRLKRRTRETTATFRRTERAKRELRGVDAVARECPRFGEGVEGCALGGDGGTDGGSAQARSASSARRMPRLTFMLSANLVRRMSTESSASDSATACSVVSRDRTNAGEIAAETGSLDWRWMINESGARRRQSERALTIIEPFHEHCVTPDVVLRGSVAARGVVLRYCELVAERPPDVDQLVLVAVGEGTFERGAVFTSLG